MPDSCTLVPPGKKRLDGPGPSGCGETSLPAATDVDFRHSGWARNRERIRQALVRSDVAQARLDAWDSCGRDAWVLVSPDPPERFKVVCSTCKDRFCLPCAASRSGRIARRLRERIDGQGVSFLTLTLRDNDVPLAQLLDKLIASFRVLRQDPRWKLAVAGGVSFIELKFNAKKQRWHPHVHAIMEAAWIDRSYLSKRWLEITGTSWRVDIKRAENTQHVIRYLCQYGAKPLHHGFIDDPERLDEAIATLKGRHLCTVFGRWRDWQLTEHDEHEQWERIDTLRNLIRRERRGDPEATAIMEQIRCHNSMQRHDANGERAPPPKLTSHYPCRRTSPVSAYSAEPSWTTSTTRPTTVLDTVLSASRSGATTASALLPFCPGETGSEFWSRCTVFSGWHR